MVQDIPEEIDENDDGGLFEHFRFEVDPGQKVLRIDKFLVDHMANTSRNRIQSAAEAGSIMVNGISVKSNYKVKPGDTVSIVLDFPRREFKLIPEDIPIDVVFEDEELMVVNKPAGMVVHPGHGNYDGTLVNALAFRFKDLPLFNTEDPRPGLVHRIDKDTSGLLVIAKSERAKNNLALQFFEKTTRRTYQALVWGSPKETEGRIEGNIGRSLKNRQVYSVFPDGDYGKHAVTHYKVLEDFGYVSFIECQLETGRTHQIRVHMNYIGHPIFNDSNYGGDQILRGTTFSKYKQFVDNCFKICPRQALHAKSLGFIHPATGVEMFFESELADDMKQLLDKWRNYLVNRIE
jgi:23S rRNA pseudouridine1911/1915/1917 synthase